MKLILIVLAVQTVLKLIGKTKENGNEKAVVNDNTRHPAEFQLR